MTRKSSPLPRPISQAKAKLDSWRHSRTTRRIPASLWRLAVTLADDFGLSLTARELRLDYQGLKARLATYKANGGEGGTLCEEQQSSFVEIPQPPMALPLPECLIEMENAGGAKLRIRIKGATDLDLPGLARSFTE